MAMEQLTNISGHRLTIGFKGRMSGAFRLSDEVNDILTNNQSISEVVFVLRRMEGFDPDYGQAWLYEIKSLSDRGYDLTFIECPRELLEALLKNMKKTNLKTIRSFVVPYYCYSCNEEYPQLINTSSMSLSFSSYNKPLCPSCKRQLSIDITEEEVGKIASLLPDHDVFADKRRYPRFDISSYNIDFSIVENDVRHLARLVNFSEAGICFTSQEYIETGINLVAEVQYGKDNARVSGLVVWSSTLNDAEYIYGVSLESNELFQLLIKT